MNIFECRESDLAKILASNPATYETAKSFLRTLKGRDILNPLIEVSLKESLQFLERANKIARQSDYYVFSVYDSWADDHGGDGCGYGVYQRVHDLLIAKLGIGMNGPASFDFVVKSLKKRHIRRVYTTDIPTEGFLGLKDSVDGDEDVLQYQGLEDHECNMFRSAGIEVVVQTSS